MSDLQPLPVSEAIDHFLSKSYAEIDRRARLTLRLLGEVWRKDRVLNERESDQLRALLEAEQPPSGDDGPS